VVDIVIRNAGAIVSGDIERPIVEGDTLVVRDGRIAAVGGDGSVDVTGIEREIDAGGASVLPGLIDSHVHPTFGDFTPRQRTLDFIDSYLHGGVTAMISAGEPHVPGRPKDPQGAKALAILAARSYGNARPSGVKVHAGALLLEKGLTENDFAELAEAGVRLVGEIGISGVADPEDAERMTRWAQKVGMRVMVHMGGASIPGSAAIDADFVLAVKPDVAAHVNGGPTAPAVEDVERILSQSDMAIEVVQCGNVRALRDVIQVADREAALHRVLVGTDSPSGTGVIPLGVLRTLSWVSALGGVAPEKAVAMATGNTARLHGLNTGRIEEGAEADLLIVDAPRGSQASDALEALAVGDTPAVAVVIIDGEVRVSGSRNTPPPERSVSVPWMKGGGH
jgi:enamidase